MDVGTKEIKNTISNRVGSSKINYRTYGRKVGAGKELW
jgi:hypothetical protein